MRFKYYLRGIGIGIIFATVILSLSFYFGRDSFFNNQMTDEEVIERATELGMVMPEDEAKEEEAEESPEESAEETDDNSIEETDLDKAAENSDSTKAEETDNATASEASEEFTGEVKEVLESDEAKEVEVSEDSSEETITYVPFTVRGGESSDTVASNLYKAGLVASSNEFNKYITGLGVDKRIQAGTFYVKQGSNYDDIVALLVNKDARTTTPPQE